MFASLKNKIREETGSDVVIKVNPPFGKRAPSSRGRHSRTGSTTSLNSIMSTDGVRDDQNVSPISSKFDEEELQKILAKKEIEFEKILKDKELEWNKQLEERENDKISALKEKEDLDKRILELEELLKITEEQKRKLAAYREDKEQLESLQVQEIGKVKQLLLQREKELAEKTSTLKENTDLVESLRGQISRLRHSEQELSCVQENTDGEVRELRERLANVELRAETVQADYARALATVELEKTTNKQLHCEIEQLRIDLKTEQDKCKELCSSYDKERNDKDATLLRNAQVSQEVEIARQRIANQDTELAELSNRLADLERVVLDKDSQLSKTESEITSLKSNVNKLEEDVLERDKNIKVLQQRLAIMKKTLQRELRSNDSDTQLDNLNDTTSNLQPISSSSNSNNTAVLQPTSQTTKYVGTNDSGTSASSKQNTNDDDDINSKYLKHVIIKFLTSREYEAKHLTRAVATLLKFSPEEERLLHETLEWKMSWFGSRPKVGNGQLAKAIPPS